jgi:hypothetical protein
VSPRNTRKGYNYNQPPEPCSQRGPTKKRGKREKQKGVSLVSVSAEVGVALLHLFLKPKTKTACISTFRAVNAIKYPPQDPAMMRLGRKKEKPVTELAVGAVVSQNQRKKKKRKRGKMTLARSLTLCHVRKPTGDASRGVCECFGSLQPMQSEEMPICL